MTKDKSKSFSRKCGTSSDVSLAACVLEKGGKEGDTEFFPHLSPFGVACIKGGANDSIERMIITDILLCTIPFRRDLVITTTFF